MLDIIPVALLTDNYAWLVHDAESGETVVVDPSVADPVLGQPYARDPRFVADGDRLRVTRDAVGHVAFGHGVHHCLGAPLARMEMRIAFPALLQRFPGLAVDIAPEMLTFRQRSIVFGLDALPVRW